MKKKVITINSGWSLIFSLGFILLSFVRELPAQSDVTIHFDKSFYVTGEVAWYRLNLPIAFLDKEIAINTAVVDGDGRQLDRFFLRTEDKTYVQGYYKFPYESETGIFEFQFRVSKGGSNPDELLASFSIPVYNDLANISNVEVVSVQPEVADYSRGDFSISVELPDNIMNRSEIPTVIRVVDQAGQPVQGTLSVSITDQGLCGAQIIDYPPFQTIDRNIEDPTQYKNDIYVQGRLGTIDNPQQVNVLGGYVGVDDKMHYTKSFEDGFFSMKLPDFVGPKMIQFVGYQFERPEISASVDKPRKADTDTRIKYSEGILEYLKLSRLRKKMFQYFELQETPINVPKVRYNVPERKADLTYNIKEYESFSDMKGFFGEIITTLSFNLGEDSIYTASLYNPKERRSKNTNLRGPPLFIVDGKITRNADFIARMSMVPIQTVEIYTDASHRRDYYQAIGISGVIKIKTSLVDIEMDPADAEDVHTCYGIQPSATFPTYEDINSATQPMVRPQIYWNPALEMDAGGEAVFTFKQSDDSGSFAVQVVFQSEDGRLGITTENYTVKL